MVLFFYLRFTYLSEVWVLKRRTRIIRVKWKSTYSFFLRANPVRCRRVSVFGAEKSVSKILVSKMFQISKSPNGWSGIHGKIRCRKYRMKRLPNLSFFQGLSILRFIFMEYEVWRWGWIFYPFFVWFESLEIFLILQFLIFRSDDFFAWFGHYFKESHMHTRKKLATFSIRYLL